MNSTWKMRLILAISVAVIILCDLLGYGDSSHDDFLTTETTQSAQKRSVFKLNSETDKTYLEGE